MKNFKNGGDRDFGRSESRFGGERRGSSDGRRDGGRRDGGFGANRGSRDGGSFGGSRGGSRDGGFGGRRDSGFGGEKVMHRATCAECGNSCEVPFKPTGEKPVYCSNCFGNRAELAPRTNDRSFSRPRVERSAPAMSANVNNDVLTEKVAELNAKIDRLLDILIENKTEVKANNVKVEANKTEVVKKSVVSDKKEVAVKKPVAKKELSLKKALAKKALTKKTVKK
ncbi:hypothetical protein JXK06_00020 [Patescibacteria group bacterium]|nr:hypothetical protein [Patescibacteria group bacterium]